jgi:hypothetical protein
MRCRLPASQVLAVAAQLGFIRCLFAVFAAVLAVCAAFRDETLAGGVRAFIGIDHGSLLFRVGVLTTWPETLSFRVYGLVHEDDVQ